MKLIRVQEYIKICDVCGDKLSALAGQRILVTGATGLIGGYLVDFLLWLNKVRSFGMQITVTSTQRKRLIYRFGVDAPLKFMQADFAQPQEKLGEFDFIIHAASPASPDVYKNNPVGVMRTNIIGTISLLDSIVGTNARFVFISSGEVYGHNINGIPWRETDLGTVDTWNPRACYPESKRASETLCVSYNAQYNVNSCVVRLCHVYGGDVNPNNNRADAEFLRAARLGQKLYLTSDGMQRRSWCYAADAVSGILYAMLYGENTVYNVASDVVATVADFADAIARMAGVGVEYAKHATRTNNCDAILCADKLVSLGWRPVYDLGQGLRHALGY